MNSTNYIELTDYELMEIDGGSDGSYKAGCAIGSFLRGVWDGFTKK